jgi:hypothetical protein
MDVQRNAGGIRWSCYRDLARFFGASGILRLGHRIGGGLVSVGLAVEFVVQLFASEYAGRLREINASLIADTYAQAKTAERAAAEADLKRVQLERWMADRVLSDEESNELVANLSRFAGQKISIRAFPPEHEPYVFAATISIALRRAGWQTEVSDPGELSSAGSIWTRGWMLYSTPDEKSNEAGTALAIELGNLGYFGGGLATALPDSENPRLELVVQTKHSPPQSSAKL